MKAFFRDILIGVLSMAIAIILAYLILIFLLNKVFNEPFFDLQPMIEELLDKTSDVENELEYFQWQKGGIKEILIAEMTNYDTAGNYFLETKTKDKKLIPYSKSDKGIYKYNPVIGRKRKK